MTTRTGSGARSAPAAQGYRAKKVAVYLDGLSQDLHGAPKT